MIACLPEISEIRDANLRERVVATWMLAVEEAPYGHLGECAFGPDVPSLSLVEHIRGVVHCAQALAQTMERDFGLGVDHDVMLAGALLHDVSKAMEFKRVDGKVVPTEVGEKLGHATMGVEIARRAGLPMSVVHIIAAHSPYSPVVPRSVEAVLVIYADVASVDLLRFREGILSPRLKPFGLIGAL